MRIISFLSDFIMPIIIFYVIAYGFISKVNIYDEFTKGAKTGFKTVLGITPTILGLMISVGVLRASGALELLSKALSPVGDLFKIPLEVIPVFIIRLFSASAANTLVFDIFKEFGTDSYAGMISSIMMSCTETVFYTMSVYFAVVKITKTRYTLGGAMFATTAGAIASIFFARMTIGM